MYTMAMVLSLPPDHQMLHNGVHLTWEDLSVTVSDRRGNSKRILEDVTGYASPGQFLAIMGPSGCGKTTLLDTLAGRLDLNARQSGEILINGHEQALAYGTSAYVTQDDALMMTLTLKETVYYSSELQLPSSMTKAEKRKRADDCIKEMGLQDVIDTRVGGWGVKGLSGGERKRLSICIEILTHPKLLFLDEPTSGLDSAASFYVMRRIIGNARRDTRTVIASIHQPSSQVFALFDHLCLLSSGRTVYFGPAKDANEFFAVNGYPCPSLHNPSDHFLQMTNCDFDLSNDELDEDVEKGVPGRKSTGDQQIVDILFNSYKSSEVYQQVIEDISAVCKQKGEISEMHYKGSSFATQCLVLTRRSFVNMHRDVGYYWMRLVVYIILALGLGTIFFNLGFDENSIMAKGWLIVFVASFLSFMSIGGFPSFVEDVKVFRRERLNGHYGATAFVIANTVSSMPFLVMVSLIPGAIAYYLPGLQRNTGNFEYFALIIFSSMFLVESLMMIVASIVPNFLMGVVIGAGIQGIMILGGGFFRLPNDLPKIFWKYPLHHISFNKYASQGLFKNEFGSPNYPNGKEILEVVWQAETYYSKWVNLGILFGMALFYRLVFLLIVKASEKLKPAIKAFSWRSTKHVKINCS